jgi:subtilisin family serine protease
LNDIDNKIGPFLGLHLIKNAPQEYKRMESTGVYAFEAIEEPQLYDPIVNVTVRFKDSIDVLSDRYDNLRIRSVVRDLATIEAPISTINQLSNDTNVQYMEASTPLQLELDKTITETKVDIVRRDFGLTGGGTVIGIVDGGFDFTHPDLRKSDGTSRILYMWDQNEYKDESEPLLGKKPTIHDFDYPDNIRELYGREYTRADLNKALENADPFSYIRQKDDVDPGHGTHVTGIAAGNGTASNKKYTGIAPQADLIVVKYWSNERLGDSNTLIDAINYIFEKADEVRKPCCCNISLGNQFGPHDGTSEFELFIDEILKEQKGRAVVKSAGNDGNRNLHGEAQVKSNGSAKLVLEIPQKDIDDDLISLWYSKEDQLEISISSPDGITTGIVSFSDKGKSFPLNNGNIVEIAYGKLERDQNKIGIAIAFKPGANNIIQPGLWSINVTGKEIRSGKFDAWIERLESASMRGTIPKFIENSSNDKSVSLPGTSNYIITVGNYQSGGNIAKSSSRGPTSDDRVKPDISCPGTSIYSAASSQVNWDQSEYRGLLDNSKKYVKLDGTSMAAPAATGIIALLLEKKPDLTIDEIKNLLHNCCRRDNYTGNIVNNTWGHGKIDAAKAFNELLQLIPSTTT